MRASVGTDVLTKIEPTFWCRIYMSGPIEIAKQAIRKDCLRAGLCVTIEPTTFIYTGGEETGFVVGLVNYPRFPCEQTELEARARDLMGQLLDATYQNSALLVMPELSEWITKRDAV